MCLYGVHRKRQLRGKLALLPERFFDIVQDVDSLS